MPDQDGQNDDPRTETARGVLPATNDVIAGIWTLFAVIASGYLLGTVGELPVWLAASDFVSIAATAYFAYGSGAFQAAGGFVKGVIQ